jgi:hypothetical protein
MGLPAGLISCPKVKTTQEWLRRHIPPFMRVQTIKTVGYVGERGLPKAAQQPGQSEGIPRENSGRDPPGDGACRDSRVTGASHGLRRVRGRPF